MLMRVGVLGFGPVVVCEDVAQRAPLRCADQCHFGRCLAQRSPSPTFCTGLAAPSEFAYNAAALLTIFWERDLCLGLECNNGLTDLQACQKTLVEEEGEQRVMAYPCSA